MPEAAAQTPPAAAHTGGGVQLHAHAGCLEGALQAPHRRHHALRIRLLLDDGHHHHLAGEKEERGVGPKGGEVGEG